MIINLMRAILIISILIFFFVLMLKIYMFSNDGKILPKHVIKTTRNKDFSGIFYGYKLDKIAFSPTDEEDHICVFGGTGSGKSTALVIPTLIAWSRSKNDTFFCIDIVERSTDNSSNKYSLADTVSCKNKVVFEMLNSKSVPYDIFYMIDRENDVEKKEQMIEDICDILIPENVNLDGASKFFHEGARDMLKAGFVAYYFDGLDFCEICTKIANQDVNTFLFDVYSKDSMKARSFIEQFKGMKDTEKAGCYSETLKAIKLFVDTKHNTLCSTLKRAKNDEKSLNVLSLEKCNIFVVVPDNQIQKNQVALRLVTAQFLNYFASRDLNKKSRILFLLDEYAQLGYIDLLKALALYRKRKIRVMCLTQSLQDLVRIYGDVTTKALLANFSVKICLNCSEPISAKYLSDLIGMQKETMYSTSKNAGNTTHSESEQYNYIVRPEKFMKLDKTLILIRAGRGWTELRKGYYYKKNTRFSSIVDTIKIMYYNYINK